MTSMTRKTDLGTEIFLDSAYVIALSARNDRLHERAVELANQLEYADVHLVTTRAVLLEIGNALSKRQYRHAAIGLLHSLEADPSVEIVPLTESLFADAFQLYARHLDKEWGLIDCVSFIVMQVRGISDALTADRHFEQAGFCALLRNRAES